MAAISFAGLVVGILLLLGIAVSTLSVGQGAVLTGFCPFAMLFSLMMATIHYKLTDTHLQLNLAFWDILGGRIRIDHIVNIVKKDNKLYISFLWKGVDPVIAHIAIPNKDFDRMKALLTDKKTAIVYYDDDIADKNNDNETYDSED